MDYLNKIKSKKTKIVATIGPVSEDESTMESLIKAGVNVVRLNFSHGSYEEHKKRLDNARKISKKLDTPIAVFQDLAGPKIRIGDFKEGKATLIPEETIILTTEEYVGDEKKVHINYKNLPNEIEEGQIILLHDGKLKLEAFKITKTEIHCKIIIGGEIKSKRGINIPGAYLKISSLTDKDKKDLEFAYNEEPDFVAISFVRKPADILELRALLDKANKREIKIIAKIETAEAIENIDEIIKVSDAIMVARGDLAPEVSPEKVPVLQKQIIKTCNQLGKPVITATQMLDSMINSTTPTRAEVSDIANAILDGTDAIMLSEETTLGSFPIHAVKLMSEVALHTEKNFPYESVLKKHHLAVKDVTDSVSYSVVNTAHDLDAKAIIAITLSGFTADMISRYKPNRPILAITNNIRTYNQLALSFNVYPFIVENFEGLSDSIKKSKKIAKENHYVKKGDLVIITGGLPFSSIRHTNTLLVQIINGN